MFQIKELLTVLAADWERFKGTKEIEVLNEYALNGRKLTLSYAGKQLFPGLLLNFHITCWKIFIWNRFNFSIVRLMFCLGCMYGAMTPFMIIPVVPIVMNAMGPANGTIEKQLMFRVDYLLDVEKYYYPLLIHSYFGTLAYITLVIAIDTMLMIYVHHACGSFALLGWEHDKMNLTKISHSPFFRSYFFDQFLDINWNTWWMASILMLMFIRIRPMTRDPQAWRHASLNTLTLCST